ncbi:MAG TPA: FGGY-family carbohydrate kinase, partial [Roseiflexaceae bacterium]|nr:FGGY-family carbohydrate kinase [Roseiflexaceae bacterium]
GHMVRAVMEGVVYSLRDGLEIMHGLGLSFSQIRATGGGGTSAFWRQMQADVYGTEVAILAAEEGPAYGAALLAGVGTGHFASVGAAVDTAVVVTSTTSPDTKRQTQYDQAYGVYRDAYGVLRDLMHRLG